MADATPTEDQNTGPWLEQKNENGTPYAVRAEGYDISKEANKTNAEAAASGPSFQNYKVNWPQSSGTTTDQETQDVTAITWYSLQWNGLPQPLGPWVLTIACNDNYNYTFYDSSDPVGYNLNVLQHWTKHDVSYASPDPTILRISGH